MREEGTIAIRGRAIRMLRGELIRPAFACRAKPGGWAAYVLVRLTSCIERTGHIHRATWARHLAALPADRQPPRLLPPQMSDISHPGGIQRLR